VQHNDSVAELSYVEDAEGAAVLADADLTHARTDRAHRLPVARLQTLLHLVQLHARFLPGALGKGSHLVEGVAEKHDTLHAVSISNQI
jgi:hypothetical protein